MPVGRRATLQIELIDKATAVMKRMSKESGGALQALRNNLEDLSDAGIYLDDIGKHFLDAAANAHSFGLMTKEQIGKVAENVDNMRTMGEVMVEFSNIMLKSGANQEKFSKSISRTEQEINKMFGATKAVDIVNQGLIRSSAGLARGMNSLGLESADTSHKLRESGMAALDMAQKTETMAKNIRLITEAMRDQETLGGELAGTLDLVSGKLGKSSKAYRDLRDAIFAVAEGEERLESVRGTGIATTTTGTGANWRQVKIYNDIETAIGSLLESFDAEENTLASLIQRYGDVNIALTEYSKLLVQTDDKMDGSIKKFEDMITKLLNVRGITLSQTHALREFAASTGLTGESLRAWGEHLERNLKTFGTWKEALSSSNTMMIGQKEVTLGISDGFNQMAESLATATVKVNLLGQSGNTLEALKNNIKKTADEGYKLIGFSNAVRKLTIEMYKNKDISLEQMHTMKRAADAAYKTGEGYTKLARSMDKASKGVREFDSIKKKEIKTVEKNTQETGKAIKKMGQFAKSIKGAGSRLRALSRAMIWTARDVGVLSGIILAFSAIALRKFKDVEQSAVQMQIALQFQGAGLEEARDSIVKLSNAASELGEVYGFSADQAMNSARIMVMTGLDTEQAQSLQEKAMQLARGTGLDLADSTEMLITTMNAYGMTLSEAGHVADIFTLANYNTISSAADLADGMTYAMGTANRWNVSLEDLTAAMTLMDRAGHATSLGGRSLATMFDTLAIKGEEYGVQVFDLAGNMLPLADVIENLRRRMETYGDEQAQGGFLSALLGKQEAKSVQALMKQQGALNELSKAYKASAGAAETASETQLKTFQGRLDQLTASVDDLILTFGTELNNVLNETGAWDVIIGIVRDMDESVAGVAKAFANKLVPAIKDGIKWLKKLIKWYKDNKDQVNAFVGAIAGLALAGAALAPVLAGVGTIMEPLALALSIVGSAAGSLTGILGMGVGSGTVGSLIAAQIATIGWTGVLGGLFAALTFIVLIVGGIVGLFEGLTGATDGVSGAGEALNAVLGGLYAIFKPILDVIISIASMVFELGRFIGLLIGQFIVFIGTLSGGVDAGGEAITLFSFLGKIFEGIVWVLEAVADVFGDLTGAWVTFNDMIADIGALEVLKRFMDSLGKAIGGLIDDFLKPLMDTLGGVLELIFGGSPGLIPGFDALGDTMGDTAKGMRGLGVAGKQAMRDLDVGGLYTGLGEAAGGGGASSVIGEAGGATYNIYITVTGEGSPAETGQIIGQSIIAEIRGEKRRQLRGPY